MTKAQLVSLLASVPDDAPVLVARDLDLSPRQVTFTRVDDWDHATTEIDSDGHVWTTPVLRVAVHLGPRFR